MSLKKATKRENNIIETRLNDFIFFLSVFYPYHRQSVLRLKLKHTDYLRGYNSVRHVIAINLRYVRNVYFFVTAHLFHKRNAWENVRFGTAVLAKV